MKLQVACFYYVLASAKKVVDKLSFVEFVEQLFPVGTLSPSHYAYLSVLDQNADSKETIRDELLFLIYMQSFKLERD